MSTLAIPPARNKSPISSASLNLWLAAIIVATAAPTSAGDAHASTKNGRLI